jgi:hypothetical protein
MLFELHGELPSVSDGHPRVHLVEIHADAALTYPGTHVRRRSVHDFREPPLNSGLRMTADGALGTELWTLVSLGLHHRSHSDLSRSQRGASGCADERQVEEDLRQPALMRLAAG